MTSSFAKTAIVLGLLAAIGPFAIDMYIPALPTIAADLKASTSAVQMTLMGFFLAFGVLQLVYGPWSDVAGRKLPLYVGVGLFTAGAVGCALAPDIGWLIAFRVVQGMGAASVMVIPRAIIRDLHTGTEATRLMALVMLVVSISPILAPLLGSSVILPFGWRAVFIAVTVAAVLSLVLIATVLNETRPAEKRIAADPRAVLSGFRELLTDARFLGLTFTGGLGMSSFFVFLSSSSFIYMEHFGLTPFRYALAFSVNAVGFFGMSQLAAQLGERFGMARTVIGASILYAGFAVLLFAATVAGIDSLPLLIALLFLTYAWLGLVIPTTMVLALDDHGPIAGIASALGGTLQMVTGGLAIVVASLLFNGTPLPMVTMIAACALGAVTLAALTLRRDARQAEPARASS